MALPKPDPNSTCVITGASSGIGREFARVLAKKGLGVTVVARRKERLDELVTEIENDFGVKAQAFTCDLADPDARKKLVEDIKTGGLNVDLLVNNAGIALLGDFDAIESTDLLREFRVNVEALVDLSRQFMPAMVERNCGGIINTASMAAFQPVPFGADYGSTKAFVLSFTEALSSELRGTQVTATVLCPGGVPTELVDLNGTSEQLDKVPNFLVLSPNEVARQAIDAFSKGKRTIVPGWGNKVIAGGTRKLPRTMVLGISRKIFVGHSTRCKST